MTAVSRNSDSTPGGTSCTLHLLGGFELFVDGRPLSIPDASQNVIAFLALQTAPVRRSFVAGSLWSGKDEARAAANLRSALWRLPPAAAKLELLAF